MGQEGNKAKILLVDDEFSIRRPLQYTLKRAGYEVTEAESGDVALKLITAQEFDLVLLDLMLGDVHGLEILAAISRQAPDTIVIVLTGYGSLQTSVEALRHGAHDYLLKPCKTVELKESIRRGLVERKQKLKQRQLLRQLKALAGSIDEDELLHPPETRPTPLPPETGQRVLQHGDLTIDFMRQVVLLEGRLLELSPTEFALFSYLVSESPRVINPQELVAEVQNYESEKWEASHLVRQHIYSIRKKIKQAAGRTDIIHTMRGKGYTVD